MPRPPTDPAAKKPARSMRPPLARPASKKEQSHTTSFITSRRLRSGAISPAESTSSVTTVSQVRSPLSQPGARKRKNREFEPTAGEETNIHVVVRCRGRSEREVKENSGVVLSTSGVEGNNVELSLGPSALSNKTYHFDKVFSPAADQNTVYERVVTPILDEMLSGYNCTIFAYGQTGTGKTYTMSGDLGDTLGLLSDGAGIIPRVLHAIFNKLEQDGMEGAVKCSFIELYNEELRDLLCSDDSTKLKIFEDSSKKSHGGTHVQGMEESYIRDAPDGIKLLKNGSQRRQVAATKCNDLSSRSHTIFTITVYLKRTADSGEDYVTAGKLNLVDLAGSENIQRSGAENKRAAEAGLINKSLLTLGRVINALVDRSSHIPYRESKLTRLLQDSLGGHTKTCIIATVSSAKSNLDETISTLDYAFRAKNIRNKPQVNQTVSKMTLFREFTLEIEKLKSELTATRQRNGVYLTGELYDEIIGESESRRILSEEQQAKLESMEMNLRNKVQELFLLNTNFNSLKKDTDITKGTLDETKSLLDNTVQVLLITRQDLAREAMLREAHAKTEKALSGVGGQLLSSLTRTVADVNGLHSKMQRKSDLENRNRATWRESRQKVSDITHLVQTRLEQFEDQHKSLALMLSARMETFLRQELQKIGDTQKCLQAKQHAIEVSEEQVSRELLMSRDDMDGFLEEVKVVREEVTTRVGQALTELSTAATRISAEVVDELGKFKNQLHDTYSTLGRDFRAMFEDIMSQLKDQQAEGEAIQQSLLSASSAATQSEDATSSHFEAVCKEEMEQASMERRELLSQITSLINASGQAQEARWASKIGAIQGEMRLTREARKEAQESIVKRMSSWCAKQERHAEEVVNRREDIKSKLKEGWTEATERSSAIQETTKTVQAETLRIADAQMADIQAQMKALNGVVSRATSQNQKSHESHVQLLGDLASSVKQSYSEVSNQFEGAGERIRNLEREALSDSNAIISSLPPFLETVRQPLAELCTGLDATELEEDVRTGETPQKVQYQYPTTLPRTRAHQELIAAYEERAASRWMPETHGSPSKAASHIFTDAENEIPLTPASTENGLERPVTGGLREVDINVNAGGMVADFASSTAGAILPPLKRQCTLDSKLPQLINTKSPLVRLEGRENDATALFSGKSRQGV